MQYLVRSLQCELHNKAHYNCTPVQDEVRPKILIYFRLLVSASQLAAVCKTITTHQWVAHIYAVTGCNAPNKISSAQNLIYIRAGAEPSLEIPIPLEPEPSSARISTYS